MFLVMVWHRRRRLATMEENLRLLEQQRRFIQDASHELGTPITVALGQALLHLRGRCHRRVPEWRLVPH